MKNWFVLLLALHAASASALVSHTYVSSTGDDVNPCTPTLPCRTFAMAINVTANGGTIAAVDEASYGSVTIGKPLTINAGGRVASLSAATGSVITVKTMGADDLVVLRGLSIDGLSAATSGIRVVAAGKLVIERCTIQNVVGHGIDFESSTNPSHLLVSDSTIANNLDPGGASSGVYHAAAYGNAVLDHVRIANNNIGVQVRAAHLSIRDSTISGNVQANVKLVAANVAQIDIDDSLIADSVGGLGIFAQGIVANVYVSNSTVTGNKQGLSTLIGSIYSFGNNRLFGNTADGAFTAKMPLD